MAKDLVTNGGTEPLNMAKTVYEREISVGDRKSTFYALPLK